MNKCKILMFSMLCSTLVSCGGESEKKSSVIEKPKTSNPLDSHVKAIQKAKDAEKKILEAAEKQRKAIDEASKDLNSATDKDGG